MRLITYLRNPEEGIHDCNNGISECNERVKIIELGISYTMSSLQLYQDRIINLRNDPYSSNIDIDRVTSLFNQENRNLGEFLKEREEYQSKIKNLEREKREWEWHLLS